MESFLWLLGIALTIIIGLVGVVWRSNAREMKAIKNNGEKETARVESDIKEKVDSVLCDERHKSIDDKLGRIDKKCEKLFDSYDGTRQTVDRIEGMLLAEKGE